MTAVDLSQFASLFEIGFALHLAVAFLDRIYAQELPVRIERIAARAQALEQLKQELTAAHSTDPDTTDRALHLAYRKITNPVWTKHNDYVLDRIYALRQDTTGQMRTLKRILNTMAALSILVVVYAVIALFMIGLELDVVQGLDPMVASAAVLMQLLPLPVAASVFFWVARRMSNEADRKIRGVGELQLLLCEPDTTDVAVYASVDQIYESGLARRRHRSA